MLEPLVSECCVQFATHESVAVINLKWGSLALQLALEFGSEGADMPGPNLCTASISWYEPSNPCGESALAEC
jgi:hypothetical protein